MDIATSNTNNWLAYLELEFNPGHNKTHLSRIKRYGPLSVQRPFYPEQECCHVYLLHPPGGVVGGDQLELKLLSKPQTRALLTTPGATKFYMSAGDAAHVIQQLRVDEHAVLEYFPQENIYFPGSRVNAKTQIYTHGLSVAMAWEKHCFGRPVIGEEFDQGNAITELELYRHDELLFTEKQRVDHEEIQRTSGLRGYPVFGTFIIFGGALDALLIRELSEMKVKKGYCGITQPLSDLVLVRYMGSAVSEINDYFVAIWKKVRYEMTKHTAVSPRIWAT